MSVRAGVATGSAEVGSRRRHGAAFRGETSSGSTGVVQSAGAGRASQNGHDVPDLVAVGWAYSHRRGSARGVGLRLHGRSRLDRTRGGQSLDQHCPGQSGPALGRLVAGWRRGVGRCGEPLTGRTSREATARRGETGDGWGNQTRPGLSVRATHGRHGLEGRGLERSVGQVARAGAGLGRDAPSQTGSQGWLRVRRHGQVRREDRVDAARRGEVRQGASGRRGGHRHGPPAVGDGQGSRLVGTWRGRDGKQRPVGRGGGSLAGQGVARIVGSGGHVLARVVGRLRQGVTRPGWSDRLVGRGRDKTRGD